MSNNVIKNVDQVSMSAVFIMNKIKLNTNSIKITHKRIRIISKKILFNEYWRLDYYEIKIKTEFSK